MKEETAVENLREIKDIFDENGVKFWLILGTLLGAVRDGKIIEWDNDMDLGLWYNDVNRVISVLSEFRSRGFEVRLNKATMGGFSMIRRDCKTDFRLYRVSNGYAWSFGIMRKNKISKQLYSYLTTLVERIQVKTGRENFLRRTLMRVSSVLPLMLKQLLSYIRLLCDRRAFYNNDLIFSILPKQYFEKLSTIKFYGMEFNIPSDVEEYLEYEYGKNWKTPTKNWIWTYLGELNQNVSILWKKNRKLK